MKRRLVTKLMMAAGVAAMAVTTIPASVFAAEDGGQTYGVTYWCESDFFKTVADSITEEAEADGNKTVVVDAQQDSAKQIQIIEDFIAQGVSAVFLNPVDKDAIEPALQKLDEAGIPVVNFDTSVSNLDLVGSYVATDNYQAGLPVYVGILGGILAGVVIGLINGYIVSSTNIPAFIVTLAMMNIGRGIARVYTKAQTISVLDDSYTFWGMGTIFGIPIQLYCIVAVIAVSSFILNKTKLGRHIYAVGGNKQAAEYSGINVKKVTFFVFVYSALLASLAGILTVGRTFTAMMTLGDGAEMDAISAVVLGGTSMNGGRGTIAGTVIGAIVIGVLKNGMNLLGIDSSWQYIVQGIVILIAVYIDWFKQTGFKFSRKIKA